MKRILVLAIFLITSALCLAQGTTEDEMRQNQMEFLRHDTLPVDITPLPSNINTQYSEYNGILFPDSTFYFSSLRPESEADYGEIFEQFWGARIYKSHLTIGGYSKPTPLSNSINDDKYYNCNFTFNKERTLMIFSRCERSQGKELHCNLWKTTGKDGHWGKPQQLNRRINLPGTTTTQPHWVSGEKYDVLYFVSDRPNGFGELDIWYTIYRDGRFDDPVNAGSALNSPDNEVTPFYDSENGRLYFSSDNPNRSIGGYDIFYADGALSRWSAPTNIGVPVNSSENDIYYTLHGKNGDGFLASNRPKHEGDAGDTCCTDLYQFHWRYEEDTTSTTVAAVETSDTVTVEEKVTYLLPITLYFHNDEPDPRTTATTTKQNYRNTLADYIALKETYKTEYAKGLKGESATKAKEKIERFFTDSVEKGFRKLEEFTQLLLTDLTAGNSVTITVCGFASPLHKADYNVSLSSRRISSFINYLKEYDKGRLLPYLNGTKANQLTIISIPEGSSMAKKEVSDNVNDTRNSVYSISASKERRIQITTYERSQQ